MNRLRRSFRNSFTRSGSKDRSGGLSGGGSSRSGGPSSGGDKTSAWQHDESSVRSGACNFFVKYLGCVEVFESRGMKVCEEALKVLRAQRRRPIKSVLYISGDGLRVVDAENKGLLVDQTIEKVSFCAPDREHEKGFAYICRDGTTRRWMCHGFHAQKETGDRLSHAVGCAFSVCLEKKQKRDRDAQTASQVEALKASTPGLLGSVSVGSTPIRYSGGQSGVGGVSSSQSMSSGIVNNSNHSVSGGCGGGGGEGAFQRAGSFRQASLMERMEDPQNVKLSEPVPVKETSLPPTAVARPAPNPSLFERQGSLRGPSLNGQAFKRHHSLRVGELPSTLLRQQQIGIPGNRVSAIPEEDSLSPMGDTLQSLQDSPYFMGVNATSGMNTAQNPPTTTTLPTSQSMKMMSNWESMSSSPTTTPSATASTANHNNNNNNGRGLLISNMGQSLDTARSKADEWLESTLQQTTTTHDSSQPQSPAIIRNYPPQSARADFSSASQHQQRFAPPPPSSASFTNGLTATNFPPQPPTGVGRDGAVAPEDIDVFGQQLFNPPAPPPPPLPASIPPSYNTQKFLPKSQSVDFNNPPPIPARNNDINNGNGTPRKNSNLSSPQPPPSSSSPPLQVNNQQQQQRKENFDDKWNSLQKSTNPFQQFSSTVQI